MTVRNAIKIAILLVIVAAVAGLYFTPARQYMTREHVRDGIDFMRALRFGPIVLIVSYGLGCIFAVPASLFIIAAGVVWGWKFGTLYAMCGGMLGASVSYVLGRFLGEGLLQKFGRTGRMVERRVASAGFKTMLIVRLIPGPPFAVWNYGAGVAGVRFSDYFFGTLLGTLPAHMIFAYSADSLFNGTMSQGDALKRLIIVAVLMIAIVVLPGLLKKYLGNGNGAKSV
jgi:uncharacterized membrane protein YdjX (TVP38/TMEM64 family)